MGRRVICHSLKIELGQTVATVAAEGFAPVVYIPPIKGGYITTTGAHPEPGAELGQIGGAK
jgi:hypothetical protein